MPKLWRLESMGRCFRFGTIMRCDLRLNLCSNSAVEVDLPASKAIDTCWMFMSYGRQFLVIARTTSWGLPDTGMRRSIAANL
jgi:hypothetical protein